MMKCRNIPAVASAEYVFVLCGEFPTASESQTGGKAGCWSVRNTRNVETHCGLWEYHWGGSGILPSCELIPGAGGWDPPLL